MVLDSLKAAGADTEDGLKRCLGKEDFYLKMINLALKNENFELLRGALQAEDFAVAFERCHALKGVTANVSLTPLYDLISELTEKLRACSPADKEAEKGSPAEKRGEDFLELYKKIREIQKNFLSLVEKPSEQ
jgi:HPt (histidine-containing phosphotransfer) domain-containing protein